jgi:hypothetical protein
LKNVVHAIYFSVSLTTSIKGIKEHIHKSDRTDSLMQVHVEKEEVEQQSIKTGNKI